jgi:hypothetical protein
MTGEDQTGKIKKQLKQRMKGNRRRTVYVEEKGVGRSRARAKSLTWVRIHVCTHFAVLS